MRVLPLFIALSALTNLNLGASIFTAFMKKSYPSLLSILIAVTQDGIFILFHRFCSRIAFGTENQFIFSIEFLPNLHKKDAGHEGYEIKMFKLDVLPQTGLFS